MKIRTKKSVIESILITMQPFLEKKDDTQITSHIYIEATVEKCQIKATDKEIGLKIITDQMLTEEAGIVTVHGKKLLEIIRILKDQEEIILEKIDNHLIVKQKHSKFKLPLFDPEQYPAFPDRDEKETLAIDSYALIRNLKKITPAIDTNNPKYELNGADIEIKENYTDLVGSDTKRLALVRIEGKSENELSLILPKKAIMEIQKLFLDDIEIKYDENYLIITNENYYFYTSLINGKYPDYERIIPKSVKHEINLPKKDMIDAIRMITTISQEISITIETDRLIFQSLSNELEAKTELEMETGIDEILTINLNSRHILDFISQTTSGYFVMGINESNLPILLKEDNFMTIIMPIVRV